MPSSKSSQSFEQKRLEEEKLARECVKVNAEELFNQFNGVFRLEINGANQVYLEYSQKDNYWKEVAYDHVRRSIGQFQFIDYCENPKSKLNLSGSRDSVYARCIAQDRIRLVMDLLLIDPTKLPKVQGINFLNGFLDLELNKLRESPKDVILRFVVRRDYDPLAVPSKELMESFLLMFKSNLDSLQILRATIRRLIDPSLKNDGSLCQLQSAIFLWGESGSGKSALLSFLQHLVGLYYCHCRATF